MLPLKTLEVAAVDAFLSVVLNLVVSQFLSAGSSYAGAVIFLAAMFIVIAVIKAAYSIKAQSFCSVDNLHHNPPPCGHCDFKSNRNTCQFIR